MYTGDIVDTHFHLFRRTDIPQHGMLASDVVQRDFSLIDYRQAMGAARVIGGIVLQAADVGTGMDELYYIERLPPDRLVSRYVSYLPIDRPDAAEIVDQLARHALVAGVRFSPSQVGDTYVWDSVKALRTLRTLAKHGMVYELSARPWQHDAVFAMAGLARETTFVLGHMGKPRLSPDSQRDWYAGIERLATLPNIICKISVPLDSSGNPPNLPEAMHPLVRHVAETFGYDRIVFGSNFPVNCVLMTCGEWLRMLDESLSDASADEKDKFYRRNAQRVYRL